ncbi:hypothetical protein [Selenomonas ruminantium]|uniref:hypothetical protein n=1 Tax=Selenomonas ruminantium TaxID=971 RepID=UPI000B0B8E07|nr:hypothetical protein [Selenomonas ruminantium]
MMAKTTKNSKDIVSVEDTGYLTLRDFDFKAAIAEEMDGLNTFFERIKMPSGETTLYQLPADNPEEPDFAKEFSAVILHHHPIRAYFSQKFNGAANPPDCGSLDAVKGFGNPGGDCKSCIYNEYNSGDNGSKACKERHRLYLLREGEMFPVILSLPTGSLKELSRYLMRLLTKGIKSSEVVTKFSLVKAANKGGIVYAKACFQMDRKLTAEEIPLVAGLSEQIKMLSRNIDFDDVDNEPAVLSKSDTVMNENERSA